MTFKKVLEKHPKPKRPQKRWKFLRLNFRIYLKKHNSCIKIQSCLRGYNFRKKNVLEPCYINEIDIDITKLKELIIEGYLTPSRIEYYKSTSTQNLNLEDGYMEFVVSKCIDGKRVGEGHCPIDVVKDDKGIDVLCVCLNGTHTNEKSIMQNFSDCGNNLDLLFENCKYQEAVSQYKREYYKKLLNAKKTKKIRELYYLAFISKKLNVYMSVFKLNSECISNIKYKNVTKQQKSIKIERFIDDKVGKATLYKSKKRLEIKFNKNNLNHFNTIKLL